MLKKPSKFRLKDFILSLVIQDIAPFQHIRFLRQNEFLGEANRNELVNRNLFGSNNRDRDSSFNDGFQGGRYSRNNRGGADHYNGGAF